VVLDLSRLGFIDCTGLRCILELDAEARNDGFSIELVPGPPVVQPDVRAADQVSSAPVGKT
jgi:anti-anti-sigma regulatory factor